MVVESIGRCLDFRAEGFVGVKNIGLLHQDLGEIGEDTPVALFVGIGQGAARGGLTDAAVIELGAQGSEAGFDIPQTLAVSQLGEGQNQKLLVGG